MFGWNKSKRDKLESQYQKLLDDAYQLSHSDRRKSDAKLAEADDVRNVGSS